MSIKEIIEALHTLTPEERQELRDWLAADEFPETDELIAAVDEGLRSAQTGRSLSIDEAKELVRKCALRSASALKQGKI
jgi:predicted transcriptional regulator